MVLLHPRWLQGWQHTHPRELSDLAWRSLLGLARTQGVTFSDRAHVTRVESERLAAALTEAMATLPHRTVPEWSKVFDSALVEGRDPGPSDYWATMEDRLQGVADWIVHSGGFAVEVRHPRQPRPSTV